jgi:biotin-dependent carboxylase-like uncharacterized protein
MDVFRVLEPGIYTTVQDGGRYGFQKYGVPVCGAMDNFAYRVSNMLVGNPLDAAVLEITIRGPKLEVLCEADVAVTGAQISLRLNDQPVDTWRTLRVKRGDILNIQQVKSGCRAYLAVTGGIEVPLVMGSRSTYVGARLGGYHGRPLVKGDRLNRCAGEPLRRPRRLPDRFIPTYPSKVRLRAVPGPQDDHFDEGMEVFFSGEFQVTPKADRMGYRLQGPQVTHKEGVPKGIISEPSVPGGVQIPPDGQPIILLLEQTVGGYPKIATVISCDIGRVAQAKPGDKVLFQRVGLEDAHAIVRKERERLQAVEEMLS